MVVKGRVDKRDDQPKLMAIEIERLRADPRRRPAAPRQAGAGRAQREPARRRSRRCSAEHPGESQVFLHLGERQVIRLPDAFCVEVRSGLMAELRVLLGPDALAG